MFDGSGEVGCEMEQDGCCGFHAQVHCVVNVNHVEEEWGDHVGHVDHVDQVDYDYVGQVGRVGHVDHVESAELYVGRVKYVDHGDVD